MINQLLLEKFSHQLDNSIIKDISENGIIQIFLKNDIVIDIDQELKFIPLLLNGSIKILREDQNGNELLIYFLESGETCTMSLTCCMETSKSKIRAVAEKSSTLVMIPVENMQLWFEGNSSWRNFILESYQKRFDEMLETIDTLAFMKMDARLYKYLKNKTVMHDSNMIKIKHQDISEDLHTSRVVISRLLKTLENEGKIVLSRNKIKVL
ncbi:Crp/Fnr family transcriptional regulator [Changchengzhania lutea]|uniref:Crp/Fnr family transcriptional regulator n=1 Tax=Changchengzhania lutea TaxID=2049305 RepID=UPI00115E632C|nr:Crp/Fnr family transcriptional regulator [Changchengzhania lutea]